MKRKLFDTPKVSDNFALDIGRDSFVVWRRTAISPNCVSAL